jgi:hypothetical protein
LKVDPTSFILNIINITGYNNFERFMMDVPPQPAISFSLHKLQMLGFCDEKGAITPMGRIANMATGTQLESLAMIMAGFVWDASIDDLIVITVMMNRWSGQDTYLGISQERVDAAELKMRNDRKMPWNEKQKLRDELRRKAPTPLERENIWGVILGFDAIAQKRSNYYPFRALMGDDFIEQIIVFRAFEETFQQQNKGPSQTPTQTYNKLAAWCDRCFINLPAMLTVYNDYVNLRDKLVNSGVDILYRREYGLVEAIRSSNGLLDEALGNYRTRLKLCIEHGFRFNTALRDPKTGHYRMVYGGQEFSYSFFGADPIWKKYEAAYSYAPDKIIFYKARVMARQKVYSLSIIGVSI